MLLHSRVLLAAPWLLLAVKVPALPALYVDPRAGPLELRAPANENPYGPRPGHNNDCEHKPCPAPKCDNPPCTRAAVDLDFKLEARVGQSPEHARYQAGAQDAVDFFGATARGQETGHLGARFEDGATTPKLGPLERGDSVHHSNNGPPGPNGPSCEHPPCPGLTRDLNIDNALSRHEPATEQPQLRNHPGSKPRAQPPSIYGAQDLDARMGNDDEGRITGPTDPTGPSCEHPPCSNSARDVNVYDSVNSDAMMARHGDHDHDPPSNGPSCKRPPCHGTPSLRALDVSASSQELTLRELKRNDQDLPPQHHGGVPKDPKFERNEWQPILNAEMQARQGAGEEPNNGGVHQCLVPPCSNEARGVINALSASEESLLVSRKLRRNDQDLPPQHRGGVPKDPKVVRAHGAPPPEPYHGSKSPSPGGPPVAFRGLHGTNDMQERKFSGPPPHPVKGGGAGGHGEVTARAEPGAQPRAPVRPPPVSGSSGSGGFGGGASGSGGGVRGREAGARSALAGRDVLDDDGSELGPLKGSSGGHGAA